MSTPSESTKPSTTAADNVGKEQHDVPKSGTIEQDTVVDDTLLKSLDAKIANEDHPAATSDGSASTTNAVSRGDLPAPGPEIPMPQGADDGEVWIPKGPQQDPNAAPKGQKPRPTRPSKPKRDD